MAPPIDAEAAIAMARGKRLVAIDGLPVSGKSTLADRLIAEAGMAAIFLDDFVRPEGEWPTRSEPGFPFSYIRYDDFLAAIRTLATEGQCAYRTYDWAAGALSAEPKRVTLDRGAVVEGVSALHTEVAPLYDLKLWVDSDATTTLEASIQRGVGAWEPVWRALFLPSVDLYMRTDPAGRADFRVRGRGA